MLDPSAYRARLVEAARPLPPVSRPITADLLGLVLAADVAAKHPIPLFDNSAMDGYAVRTAEVAGAAPEHPITLPVGADIAAGDTGRHTLAPGTAARIMTGAPMPDGADAVVQVELTDGGTLAVTMTGGPGEFVRRAGADLGAGDLVLAAGTVLTARALAAAIGAGHAELSVVPRPRVAVVSTGSELVEPGVTPEFGQIPDSNGTLIAALLRGCADVVGVHHVPDDAAALTALLAGLDADAVVLSGGVSAGAYDVVKEALAPEPGMWFGPVAMQPGKPQGSGRLADGTAVYALPGNPVSVYVSVRMLVEPALRRAAGHADVDPIFEPAVAGSAWRTPPGREQYLPVRIEHDCAPTVVDPASAGGSGSHLLGSLALADGLVRVPADIDEVAPGDPLDLWRER